MKKILTIIMSAALLVCAAIPTFAATSYPEMPNEANGTEEFEHIEKILFQRDNGSIHCVVFGYNKENTKLKVTYNPTDSDKFIYAIQQPGGSGEYLWYTWYLLENVDGTTKWSKQSKSYLLESNNARLRIPNVTTFLSSTVDILDYNDNSVVLFPQAPQVNQTQAEMVMDLVVTPIMKTLLILVPFGVGLMALLILLVILKKVFYQFRV